jgi:hypothetical protein
MMSPLEEATSEANAKITAFLGLERPELRPLFDALAKVEPFLPCRNPSPEQQTALQEYRQSLESLQAGIERLTGQLWSRRSALLAQRRNLDAARTYQQFAKL